MDETKSYTVTTQSLEDTDLVYDDLVANSSSAETVPSRPVEVANERPNNALNTEYFLTDEEASLLANDPRVVAVEQTDLVKPFTLAFDDYQFSKDSDSNGSKSNWGLLRHIKVGNIYGATTADPNQTYDYTLDGTGVDIVIIDSGIQADHPEFNAPNNGNSRVQQIDWYAASGVSGTMPVDFYTDFDGHGTHVAGIIAGKSFGWAKNADIYSIKLAGLEGGADPNSGMSVADAFDCLLGWHNAKTNGRPTIVNNSWGYLIFWHTSQNSFSYSPFGGPFYGISGGSYRGVAWSGSTKDTAKGHTGSQVLTGVYSFPQRVTSVDADVTQLINAGIIVCNAAGNEFCKIDVSSGTDYDNYVTAATVGTVYYHRGGSPNVGAGYGFEVGSFGPSVTGPSNLDSKSTYSNSGPGVTMYAAGGNILSAMSDVNSTNSEFAYHLNGNFKQEVYSGTSMAAPQIAGITTLLKQIHPDWTPRQVHTWLVNNTRAQMYTTELDNDYTVNTSIHGGSNRIAYWPLAAQKYYEVAAS